eukprot:scaffold264329_cov30-Tisochrysis_lutea.AAC.2
MNDVLANIFLGDLRLNCAYEQLGNLQIGELVVAPDVVHLAVDALVQDGIKGACDILYVNVVP